MRHSKETLIKTMKRWWVLTAFALLAGGPLVLFQNCAKQTQLDEYVLSSETTMQQSMNDEINALLTSSALSVRDMVSDTSNAAAFGCLVSSSTQCLTGTAKSILVNRLYDSNRKVLLDDLLNARRGLNEDGEQCATFNFLNSVAGLSDAACPLRIEIYWQPICANNTLNCANSALQHKFRVKHVRSELGQSNKIISDDVLVAKASLFAPETFSNQRGSGVKLFSYNIVADARTDIFKYRSCQSPFVLNASAESCGCATGYTEDLDNGSLCVDTSRACPSGTIANSATCTQTYSAANNSYSVTAFTCSSGFTKSGSSCIQLKYALVETVSYLTPGTYTCGTTYTFGQACPVSAGTVCNSSGAVVCCTGGVFSLITGISTNKFRCQ